MSSQPPYPVAPGGYAGPPPGYPPGYPAPAPAKQELARRQTILFILLFLMLVGLAFFMPGLFLLSGDRYPKPQHVYHSFREGGLGMWGILLSQMFVWALTAGLGALLIRGTRVPGAVLFVLGLMPFGIGALASFAGAAKITGALSGESVDPSQKARILAMGTSELTNLFLYGGTVSGFALYLTAVAAVLGLVTVDPAPLGPAPKSSAWLLGLPVAFGFALVALGVRVGLGLPLFVLDGLVVFGILTAGALAAAGSRTLPALVASGKEDEAGRAFRQLLLAGLALAAAMVVTDRALVGAAVRRPFAVMSEMGGDMAQRVAILQHDLVPAMRWRPILMVLDAVACLAAFVPALVAARAVKGKVSILGGVAGAAAALTGMVAFFATSSLDAAAAVTRKPFEELEKTLADSGITLPKTRSGDGSGVEPLPRKPELVVKKDGSLAGTQESGSEYTRPDIAADGAVTLEALMGKAGAAILKGGASRRIGFTLLPQVRLDLVPLGTVAAFLGSDLLSLPVTLHGKLATGLPVVTDGSYAYGAKKRGSGILAVLPDGEVGRMVALSRLTAMWKLEGTVPLADDASSREARKRAFAQAQSGRFDPGMILLAPPAGDTLAHIVAQLQAIASSLDSASTYRQTELSMDLALTADRAALEAAPTLAEMVDKLTPATPSSTPTTRPPRRRGR